MCVRTERIWLTGLVGVSGAAAMALELLGARMLATVFGGSVVVWGGMIAVTLISLAVGYLAGGRAADRYPRGSLLASLVIVASIATALCTRLRPLLTLFRDLLGLRMGVLCGATALFLLPMGLLGAVGPFVIRLISEGKERAGSTAGSVYALSTVGGVVGTLATAFWLIPGYGVAAGIRATAVLLAITASAGFFIKRNVKATASALIVVALVSLPEPDTANAKFAMDSLYGRVEVAWEDGYRLLAVDGIVQTGMPDDLRVSCAELLSDRYYPALIPYLVDDPEECTVLVIGLAGGLAARLYADHGMEVDCVELDPIMVDVAREWFGFSGNVTVKDGRQYLESCEKTYDFCLLDAYSGDVLPPHLITVEAIQLVRSVLSQEGVLAVNFIGSPRGAAFESVRATLEKVFANVRSFRSRAGTGVQAITLFASDGLLEFNGGWLSDVGEFAGVDPVSADLLRMEIGRGRPATVLTDDHNPLDALRAGEVMRRRRDR